LDFAPKSNFATEPLRADLASARLERRRAGGTHGVPCISRRQEHWKPTVDDMGRGQVTPECFPGTDRDGRLEPERWLLDGRGMAADGPSGRGRPARPRRLVGVHTPTGHGCVLTHLPPRLGPRQVAALYRVRWEGELRIRREKSVTRLDASDADRPCALKTRWHASLIASTIGARRAPTHHVHTRPQAPGAPRTQAPRQPRRLALPHAVSGQSIAQARERTGAEATPRWPQIAAWRTPRGRAPHWRRRPSVRAQLRGWNRQPMTRHKTNGGEVNHGHFKAAASVDTYGYRWFEKSIRLSAPPSAIEGIFCVSREVP